MIAHLLIPELALHNIISNRRCFTNSRVGRVRQTRKISERENMRTEDYTSILRPVIRLCQYTVATVRFPKILIGMRGCLVKFCSHTTNTVGRSQREIVSRTVKIT
jgi:hypothetical protein